MRGQGVGKLIVERLIATVRELGIARVFVLTFERDFFAAFGFREIEGTPVTAEVYAELRGSSMRASPSSSTSSASSRTRSATTACCST